MTSPSVVNEEASDKEAPTKGRDASDTEMPAEPKKLLVNRGQLKE